MALKLTITSAQRAALGAQASILLGVGGGSIGRAHDNDWVLPDPQRYLSAHHARVQFRDGHYYLLDTSSNGVYVNDAGTPIGRRASYALRNGDVLRFGEYRVAVRIDAETAEAAEASSVFALPGTAVSERASLADDIGADLSVRSLLGADRSPSVSSRIGPVDAFGQPALTEDTGLLAFDSGARPAGGRPSPSAIVRRELQTVAESIAGFEAFCRGAGIDAQQLPADAQARLLHLAGLLLREALAGIKGLALTQREIRGDHRLDEVRDDPQHVALQGLPVEELLTRLLVGHGQHELDAVQWLRDTLGGARRHDLAVMRALQAALGDYLIRLDPEALSQPNIPREGARGGSASPPGVPEWTGRFRSITDMPKGKLPLLFTEAFARAFAAEFSQMNPPSRPGG